MQAITAAYQLYQVLRYATLMGSAMALAWLGAARPTIEALESMLLLAGATSFFWVGSLLDAYLLHHKRTQGQEPLVVDRLTLLLHGAMSVAAALVTFPLIWLVEPAIPGWIALLFAGYWLLEGMGHLLPYYYVAHGMAVSLRSYAVAASVIQFLGVAIPLLAGFQLEGVVVGMLIAAAMKLLWLVSGLGNSLFASGDALPHLKAIWGLAWPLGLAALLSQSSVYVDGLLVREFFPQFFVEFRYGAKEFPLVLLLANGLSMVKAGEIAAARGSAEEPAAMDALRAGSRRLMRMLFPLTALLLIGSNLLFHLAFAGRFVDAVPIFDLYLLLIVPRLLFPQTVLRGWHHTRIMSVSAAAELLLNVALSLLLMQWWGIGGIAAGTVLAFIGEKVILFIYVRNRLGIPASSYMAVGEWWAGTVAVIGIWLAKYLFFAA